MKKINLLIGIFALLVGIVACEKDDAISNNIYDNSGQTGVGFRTTSASVSVTTEGTSISIPAQTTTTSDVERTYPVQVVTDGTTGTTGDYTYGEIVIPAGEYDGSLTVNFVDTNLEDMVSYDVIFQVTPPEGIAIVGSETVTISYNKYVYCNDLNLKIITDTYGDETTWDITDDTGATIASGGPYSQVNGGGTYNESIYLEDGCYTFTIYDAYGDGLYDGTVTGSYTLSCSIITHATGSGNFGSSQSTDFCVNP